MELDDKVEKLIIKHWEQVSKKISKIEEGKPNYRIKDYYHYLNPPVLKEITPLSFAYGELQYYITIRDILRRLMNREERVESTCHFKRAPKEIKQLLDKS